MLNANKLALYEPLAHKKNGKAKSFPVLFVLLQVFPKVQIHNIPDVDKTAAVQNRPLRFPAETPLFCPAPSSGYRNRRLIKEGILRRRALALCSSSGRCTKEKPYLCINASRLSNRSCGNWGGLLSFGKKRRYAGCIASLSRVLYDRRVPEKRQCPTGPKETLPFQIPDFEGTQ